MIIGVAGTKYNKKRLGEGTGRVVLTIAMMYHLLKEEEKELYSFEQFYKGFKTKAFRDKFTPDKFIVPCVYVSEHIVLKEMLAPLLGCKEEDLNDINYLVRPIREFKSNVILLNGEKQIAIKDKNKAEKYVKRRNAMKPIDSTNEWEVKNIAPTPLTLLHDLKKCLQTNVHNSAVLSNAIRIYGKNSVIFYPNLENLSTFNLINNLGGATIHIDNPNKKGNIKVADTKFDLTRSEFDYEVINNSDIENLYREANIIIKDLLNGV